MDEEQVSKYLQKLCIEYKLEFLTKNKKKNKHVDNKYTNIDDFLVNTSNKPEKIKTSSDKKKQYEQELIKRQLKNTSLTM